MINIVNPAGALLPCPVFIAYSVPKHRRWDVMLMVVIDPDSFSMDQYSAEESSTMGQRRERETTPIQEYTSTPMLGTPSGSEVAKRGILRSTGTPGSGNGGKYTPPTV